MSLFLSILSLIAIAGIVIVVILLAWGFLQVRHLRSLAQCHTDLPITFEMTGDDDDSWASNEATSALIRSFEEKGFERVGHFNTPTFPDIKLIGWHHHSDTLRACLFHHPELGEWIDLCGTTTDGIEVTLSNAPAGEQIRSRPDTEKIISKGLNLESLLREWDHHIGARELKPVTKSGFVEEVILSVQKDLDWNRQRCGVSEEEFREVASSMGLDDDDWVSSAYHDSKCAAMELWEVECIAALQEKGTLSDETWQAMGDQLFIFHESFPQQAYAQYLARNLPFPSESDLLSAFEEAPPQATLMQRLTQACTRTGIHIEEIGAVDTPISAKVIHWKQ
jgi:hypothetical protein